MWLFSLQVPKITIWKAFMPSIRSRPEGPKYGEKNLLWILQAASSSYELPALPPPLPHMLQHLPRFLLLPWKKLYATFIFLYYYLYYFIFKKLLTNLLLRKDNFRK
jgi:hypothetical protein